MSEKKPRYPSRSAPRAKSYEHADKRLRMRPEIGSQARFSKKKEPKRYCYDSALAPSMNWDSRNPGRDFCEFLLACAEDAAKLPPPHLFDEPRRFEVRCEPFGRFWNKYGYDV